MKLQQGQIWKKGDAEYLLIVEWARLTIVYKAFTDLVTRIGKRQQVTKKEFCRLLSDATLMTEDEVKALSVGRLAWGERPAEDGDEDGED